MMTVLGIDAWKRVAHGEISLKIQGLRGGLDRSITYCNPMQCPSRGVSVLSVVA